MKPAASARDSIGMGLRVLMCSPSRYLPVYGPSFNFGGRTIVQSRPLARTRGFLCNVVGDLVTQRKRSDPTEYEPDSGATVGNANERLVHQSAHTLFSHGRDDVPDTVDDDLVVLERAPDTEHEDHRVVPGDRLGHRVLVADIAHHQFSDSAGATRSAIRANAENGSARVRGPAEQVHRQYCPTLRR